jgi:hypothetical protein
VVPEGPGKTAKGERRMKFYVEGFRANPNGETPVSSVIFAQSVKEAHEEWEKRFPYTFLVSITRLEDE